VERSTLSRLILHLFYFFLLAIVVLRVPTIVSKDYSLAEFVGFATPLEYFVRKEVAVLILAALTFTIIGMSFKTLHLGFRIPAAFLFSAFIYCPYAFGKIDSNYSVWISASFALLFYSEKIPLSEKRNALTIDIIQAMILTEYFIAGLWKTRAIISMLPSWDLRNVQAQNVAIAIAEGSKLNDTFMEIFLAEPAILELGFFSVLLFQLTALVPVFFRHFRPHWGWMALTFHFSAGLTLGTWFSGRSFAVAFFLILLPQLKALHLTTEKSN
jgi:hypothetical protein